MASMKRSRRGQKISDDRPAPFSYVTHDSMRAMQVYFATHEGELKSGIALYMGISFLLSTEEHDGFHSKWGQWKRKEISLVSGLSEASISRYAEHLEIAGVLAVEEDTQGGQGAHLWRLMEPRQGSTAPSNDEGTPSNGDEAPSNGDEASIRGNKGKEGEEPSGGFPPGDLSGIDQEAFSCCRYLAKQAGEEPKPQEKVSKSEAAGARWLVQHVDREEIKAVVAFAHQKPYNAARARTAGKLRQSWEELRVEWRSSQTTRSGGGGGGGSSAAERERLERNQRRMRGESL